LVMAFVNPLISSGLLLRSGLYSESNSHVHTGRCHGTVNVKRKGQPKGILLVRDGILVY
jgi:hypothetical protein